MAADYVTMLMDTYPDADSINSECKVVGDVVGDGTQDGELVPTVCSNNSFNSPYWTTLNVFNKPQCTWYAYGRALQILTENAGMNVNDARGLMNKMFTSSSGRHAGVWYSMNAQTQTFSASTNIDDARPGAIIVWAGTGFGHVAIVESVQKNSDGTISSVTLTQGNVSGKECGNDTYNRGQMETQNYDKRGRHFVGYIYLLN